MQPITDYLMCHKVIQKSKIGENNDTLYMHKIPYSLNMALRHSCYLYVAITVKNVVHYMALRSANHTVIRVVNTTHCHMIHQLVWYAHFIFYGVAI